jgi:hypothetical protein
MDSSAHNPMVNDEGITSFDESSRGNFEIELGNLSPNIYGIVEDDNEGGQVTVEFNPHFSGLPMSFVEVKQAD